MKKDLPEQIPVFPLNGVIYFPKTNLPLNIFEQRYLDLVNDAIKKDRLIGMIQLKKESNEVYKIGCLGKISDFQKSKDGRILINLTGVSRFEVVNEVKNKKLYREFMVHYKKFNKDLDTPEKDSTQITGIEEFMEKTKKFFKRNGLLLNWKEFDKLSQNQKINTLAMIAPVSNEEKQKLLETITVREKTQTLLEIIEFYLHDSGSSKKTVQ